MQRSHPRQLALWLLLLGGLAAPAMGVVETLQLAGTGGALESMRQMGTAFVQHVPNVTVKVVPAMGSQGSIKAVLAGAIDISLSARALQEEEVQTGAKARAYAPVPFVFATPEDNPHQGLSQTDLAKIYDGRRTK